MDCPIFIPVVNRLDLLIQAIESLDNLSANVIVLNNIQDRQNRNSLQSLLQNEFGFYAPKSYTPTVPLFFAQSFTWMMHITRRDNHTRFCFMHADAILSDPGVYSDLMLACDTLDATGKPWGVHFTRYDLFACYNLKALDKAGIEPDPFLPIYTGDNDFYRRMTLTGLPLIDDESIAVRVMHNDGGSATTRCDFRWKAFVDSMDGEKYYAEKWGGKPGHETYQIPWNGRE